MTDTSVDPRLFSLDPAERRAFRDRLGEGIAYYSPPELRQIMQFLGEATPSSAVERAGSASMRAVQPDRTVGQRIGDVGEVLSETAGVVAPAMAAVRGALPAAEAVQEAFLGASGPARAAAETVLERLNQPGPMPETLFSGVDPTTPRRTFDQMRADAGARIAARDETVGRLASDDAPVRFSSGDLTALVSRSPDREGWRVTYFQPDGIPSGHSDAPDKASAVRRALEDQFLPVDQGPRTAAPAPLPAPRNSAEETSDRIAALLREGKVDEAEALLDFADDRRLYQLYERGEVGMDLPMDLESRMRRAGEMGFVEDEYIGSMEPNIRSLDPRMARGDRRYSGTWSSDNPYVASSYADPRLGSVYPLLTRGMPENAIRFDAQGENWRELPGYQSADIGGRSTGPISVPLANMGETGMRGNYNTNQVARIAFFDGLPGAEFRNVVDRGPMSPMVADDPSVTRLFQERGAEPSTVRARQDTSGVRSRFARFDPRFANSRNLMAGVGGAGVMMSLPEGEEDPAVRGYAQGGEVMMRSSMPDQMRGGIGGLNDRAREMFRGPRGIAGFAQYMQTGGEVLPLTAVGRGDAQGSQVGAPVFGPAADVDVGASDDRLAEVRARVMRESGADPVEIAMREGVDPDLFLRLIAQESGGRASAKSEAGAYGFTQLMPATARELGVNRENPIENLVGGARYLRQQLDRFQEVPLALAAYNAGPNAVERFGGIPPYAETRGYVARIMGLPGGEMAISAPSRPDPIRPMARPAPQMAPVLGNPLFDFGQALVERPAADIVTPASMP